jgi:hypothetical protein
MYRHLLRLASRLPSPQRTDASTQIKSAFRQNKDLTDETK